MEGIEELKRKHRRVIQKRLKEFKKISGEDIFYELCFCIMAVQTSGKKSWDVVMELKKKDFFRRNINPAPFLRKGYIRFHNTKSKHLILAKKKYFQIKKALTINNVNELREWLIFNVRGIGMKEASHFLRNIGKTEELAILDRHILRNMKLFGARMRTKTLTKKTYLSLEKKFMELARKLNMKPAELDLLLWAKEVGVVFK